MICYELHNKKAFEAFRTKLKLKVPVNSANALSITKLVGGMLDTPVTLGLQLQTELKGNFEVQPRRLRAQSKCN